MAAIPHKTLRCVDHISHAVDLSTSHKRSITMKYLAIVSFVIGVLVAPIAAQAQQSLPGSPQGFNGLVWDPPTQTYVVPDATK
jgi:hypothetical protein